MKTALGRTRWAERRRVLAVVLALGFGPAGAAAQQLDQSCTVTVNGQTVQVNPDGTFVIPNIAAADLFGPGGPGTPPDFLSDDFRRLTGVCTAGAAPVYVTSQCFRIRSGQSLQIDQLTFSNDPRQALASIRAAPGVATLTALGQQTSIDLTGRFNDGSSGPLDPALHCPATFRTGNPAVVSVAADAGNPVLGVATARGPGTALITASVEGATSVTSITVSLADPLTTVTGIVQTADGDSVDGAVVRFVINGVVISGTGVTGGPGQAPGQFIVPGVASQLGPISAYAEATVDASQRSGVSLSKTPVPDGFTDAGLIALDDRIVWITNADGQWTTGANWIGGAPPRATQIAIIDVPADITVTHQNLGTTTVAGLESAERFSLVQGTLALNGASVVNAPFTQSGSGLLSGSGTLTVNGLYTWTGGSMEIGVGGAGTTVLNGGMTLSGTGSRQLVGRTLTNANNGTMVWTGGALSLSAGATINNPSGSTFDVQSDEDIGDGFGFNVLNNAGMLRKSAGTGVTMIGGVFNNSGAVEVQTGTLQFAAGTSSGSFIVSPGAGLEFSTSGGTVHNVNGSVRVPAGATLRVTGFSSVANFNGPMELGGQLTADNGTARFNAAASSGVTASSMTITGGGAGGGALIFAGAASAGTVAHGDRGLLGGAGTLTVNGPYDWSGGTMGDGTTGGTTLLVGGMTMSGTGTKQLTGRTLINANNGLIRWAGGPLNFGQGSVLNNEAGATFQIESDSTIGPSASTFHNAGTLRKTAGTGLSSLAGITFNNTGAVEVQTGTMRLPGGTSPGSFTVSPGAALEFAPTFQIPQNISGTVNVPVGGALRFSGFSSPTFFTGPTQIAGQIVTGNGTGSFNALASVGVTASSMSISGAGAGTGALIFAGNVSAGSVSLGNRGLLAGAGTLTVNGPFDWSAGNLGDATAPGATILNGGLTLSGTGTKQLAGRTLTNANNGTMVWTGGALLLSAGATINNSSGSTFEVQTDGDIGGGGGVNVLNNAGTFRKSGGTASPTFVSVDVENSGLIEVTDGTLDFNTSGAFTQTSGSTVLAGGSMTRTGIGRVMQINGGTIGLGPNTPSGTITGNVTLGNAAASTVPRPGAAGTLTVNGTYTQNAGVLDIELGGLTPDTEHDRLTVSGTAVLGGTLELSLINGFIPEVGQQFTILSAGTRTGTFAAVEWVDFPVGLGAGVTYSPTAATVTITAP